MYYKQLVKVTRRPLYGNGEEYILGEVEAAHHVPFRSLHIQTHVIDDTRSIHEV